VQQEGFTRNIGAFGRFLEAASFSLPQAKAHLLYLGNRRWHDRGVEVLPFTDRVSRLDHWL
jgi:hypothetical protein